MRTFLYKLYHILSRGARELFFMVRFVAIVTILYIYRMGRFLWKRIIKPYAPVVGRKIVVTSKIILRYTVIALLFIGRHMRRGFYWMARHMRPVVRTGIQKAQQGIVWTVRKVGPVVATGVDKARKSAVAKNLALKFQRLSRWLYQYTWMQKTVRGWHYVRTMFRRHRMKAVAVNAGVIVMITVLAIGGSFNSIAATNTWTQSDWSGGVGTSTTNQFESQTNIDFATSGEIVGSVAGDWYNANWTYRDGITISSANVSGSDDLINYPLYIDTTNADWRSTANGGRVAQNDGGDIVFTDSDGNKLGHQIDTYTASSGRLEAWVRVPVLSYDADTTILMYYGNSAGGLDESDQVGGVQAALDFDGVDDYVEVPAAKSLNAGNVNDYMEVADSNDLSFTNGSQDSPFSIATRMYFDGDLITTGIISKRDPSNSFDAEFGVVTTSGSKLAFTLLDKSTSAYISRIAGSTTLQSGRWYSLVVTYDGSGTQAGMKIYLDGTRVDTTNDGGGTYVSMENTTHPLRVGIDRNNSLEGRIDQTAVWSKELSASEALEYHNADDVTEHSAYVDVVSWYDFEDTDISGTTVADKKGSNNGTLIGGATNSSSGEPAPLSFGDGTTDQPFSVSTEVYFDGAHVSTQGIMGKRDPSTNLDAEYGFLTDSSGRLVFIMFDKSASAYILSNTTAQPFQLGQWHSVVATYDGSASGSGVNIYVDGNLMTKSVSTSGTYTAMENTTHPLRLGTDGRNGLEMEGKLRQPAIWGKELSSAEVVELYDENSVDTHSAYSDVVSWYDFTADDISGTAISDKKSTNDGVLNGGLSTGDILYSYPRPLPDPANSLDFNGSNEYIDIFSNETVPADFQNLSDSVGVSFFFRQDVSVADASNFWSSAYTILDFRELGGTDDHVPFSIGLNNTKVRLGVSDNFTSGAETADSATYADNTWKHAVVNIDGDDWEIWLNGELSNSGTFVTATGDRSVGTGASSLTIGSARSSANATLYRFDGNLHQLLLKGEPFTEDQVVELYNDGTPVAVSDLNPGNNFLATYYLDGNDDYATSGGVVDYTGGYNGTAVNMDATNVQTDYPREQNSYATAGWITTSDANIANPSTFYTLTQPTITGNLTSASFDTGDADSFIGDISWTATVPGSSTLGFQIRTAPDNGGVPGTWSDWLGPTGTGDYYTTAGGNTINSTHTDAVDDQWVQYRLVMEFTGGEEPTVEDVTVTYVANSAPEFNADFPSTGAGGVSATMATDGSGTVDIEYSVRDIDTTTGTTNQGFITPSFEYSTNGGSSWTTITGAYLEAADVTTKAVGEVSYTTHTATWDAGSQVDVYSTQAQIRVTADDGEGGNNTATATSQSFILDTNVPVVNSFVVDASTSPAALTISCSDDTSLQMQYGLQSNISDGSYTTYNTSATLSGVVGGDAVYLQCKDAYGNESTITATTVPDTPTNLFYQDISDTSTSNYRLFVAWSVVNEPTPGFASYKIYRSTDGSNYSLHQTITNRSTNFIIDDGLSTGTTYYYRLTTTDDAGNVSSYSSIVSDDPDGQGGSDLTAPTISNITESALTATGITISWNTNELSNSTLYYEATSSNPGTTPGNYESSQGVPSFVTDNTVSLSNLEPGTQYYYLATSADPSGNTGIATTSGTFTTNSGPSISGVSASQVFNDEATVTWSTDAPASSTLYYSTNSDMSSLSQLGTSDLVSNHSVTIPSLTNGTKYYFYVASTDASSNTTDDRNIVDGEVRYYSFTTTSDAVAPVISNVSAALTGETGATIAWETDEGATSQVEWGTSTSLGTLTTETSIYTTQHAVTLTGLENTTTYYYRVISADRAGNSSSDNNSGNTYSFLTLTPTINTVVNTRTETVVIQGDDARAPVISNVSITPLSTDRARLTFETNEVATASADYGSTTDMANSTTPADAYSFSHSVVLSGLAPGTTYYYRPVATDAVGNTATGTQRNFVHAEPVETSELALTSQTRELLATLAQSNSFDEASALAQQAFADLQALGINVSGGTGEGEPTAGEFAIINPQFSAIGARTATLTWRTTRPARTAVEVVNLGTGEVERFDSSSYVSGHTLELTNLSAQTSYTARITAENEEGIQIVSALLPFSTSTDTAELEIFDLETNSTLIPGRAGRVQTIISWRTNKPATSQVFYGRTISDAELAESTPRNPSFATEHVVIISDFDPGVIYRVQAESRDRNDTSDRSEQYSLLTPRSRENIIDVIIENVQDTFGVFLR